MRPLIGPAAPIACLHLGVPFAQAPPQNPRQQPPVFRDAGELSCRMLRQSRRTS